MVGNEEVRKIHDFVKKETAFNADTGEANNIYFRAQIGPTVSRSKGFLSGVYASHFGSIVELQAAVVSHVAQAWEGDDCQAQRIWLLAIPVGAKKPNNFLAVDFEDGGSTSNSYDLGDVDLKDAGAMTVAAAHALLATNQMLLDHNERTQRHMLSVVEDSVETKARLLVAQGQLDIGFAQADERRVTMMWDRADPHLEKLVPALTRGLMAHLAGMDGGAKQSAAGDGPPDDPDKAADWHVQQLLHAGKQMGLHFVQHPKTLTKEREAELTDMIGKLVAAAEAIQSDDE